MASRPGLFAFPASSADELRRLYEVPERIGVGLDDETAARLLDLAKALLGTDSASLLLSGDRAARGERDLGLGRADLEAAQPALRRAGAVEIISIPLRVPLLTTGRGASRVFGALAAPARAGSLDLAASAGPHLSALLVADAIARAADHDKQTGLLSRAAFERALAQVSRRVAEGERFALLLLDLDDLGAVNATRGYREGDRLLESVAGLVASERPADALAARIGGDELALLCPALDGRGATELATRLRRAVAASDATSPPTVCLGIACAPDHGESGDELLSRAFQALAEAKALGKDRAVAWFDELRGKARRERLQGVLTGDLARDYRNVEALLETARAVARLAPIDETLVEIVDRSIALAGGERGLLLVRDPRGAFTVRVARLAGRKDAPGPFELAASVAEASFAEGRAILRMAKGDEEISTSAEQLGIKAVLCAPLRGEDVPDSALYVDARAQVARFDRPTLAFFDALASVLVIALRNARLHERVLERARRAEADVVGREAELVKVKSALFARERAVPAGGYEGIVGTSPAIGHLFALLRSLEGSIAPVLIEGESGTGKELVARAIHARSARRGAPFVSESCAAISETLFDRELFGHVRGAFTGADSDKPGLLEAAHQGTLFLDELGELPLMCQAKLLRALQEGEVRRLGDTRTRPVDVRVIAATNKDLSVAVVDKSFREDLFYRLAVVRVALPPLRDRPTDVPLLVEHFLGDLAKRGVPVQGITASALGALVNRRWRGNVRELGNVLERAAILAGKFAIAPEHLVAEESPATVAAGVTDDLFGLTLKDAKDAFATLYAKRVLEREGSIAAAARKAGASRQTFYRLLSGDAAEPPRE